MHDISLNHSSDHMKAFLYVSDLIGGTYPAEDELRNFLTCKGITTAVNTAQLREMERSKACNIWVEVAQGTPPIPGTPGRIEILVDVSNKGKPRRLADGRVDHHDISYVVNVRRGTPLVKHVPPVPGKPGATIFNAPIEPPIPQDTPLAPGSGTALSSQDPHVLVADINGAVVVHANGNIEVVDSKIISGNIDYSTGNVHFSGNLRVTGTVRAGFEVLTEGDCHIGGNVEDAKITSYGDMEIIGGAIGTVKGSLKSGGSLKVRHLANFTVQAGEDICILEDSVHSVVWADGNITVKSVVGGTVAAWKTIEAESIGTEAEARTIVDLGGRFVLMQKKYALLKKTADLTGELGSLKEAMFKLVRDEMNPDGGLADGAVQRLEHFKKKHAENKEHSVEVQSEMEILDKKLAESPVPFLRAQNVFPNTLVKFGVVEKVIKEKLENVRITVDGDKIVIGK